MIDELNSNMKTYFTRWKSLVGAQSDKTFFEALKPVAVGWKVADRAEYDKLLAELHDQTDKIIETWMNGRWVAKLHLTTPLESGIQLVKLMQRRPDSDDPLGLDHVDFYNPAGNDIEAVVQKEAGLKWTWESNDIVDDYRWISFWFDGTEAKVRNSTVLDTIADELQQLNNDIKA
jgi:hypothetical protein